MNFRQVSREVDADVVVLVSRVTEFSRRQKALWQKIPFLALSANGRSGYSDQYSRAYGQGYWAVEASVSDGEYCVYVDLETGKLVNATDPRRPAKAEDVLRIARSLDQLDAASIVKSLEVQAKEPIGSYYDAKARRERKQRIAAILREGKIKRDSFRRSVSPREVYEGNVVGPLLDMLG